MSQHTSITFGPESPLVPKVGCEFPLLRNHKRKTTTIATVKLLPRSSDVILTFTDEDSLFPESLDAIQDIIQPFQPNPKKAENRVIFPELLTKPDRTDELSEYLSSLVLQYPSSNSVHYPAHLLDEHFVQSERKAPQVQCNHLLGIDIHIDGWRFAVAEENNGIISLFDLRMIECHDPRWSSIGSFIPIFMQQSDPEQDRPFPPPRRKMSTVVSSRNSPILQVLPSELFTPPDQSPPADPPPFTPKLQTAPLARGMESDSSQSANLSTEDSFDSDSIDGRSRGTQPATESEEEAPDLLSEKIMRDNDEDELLEAGKNVGHAPNWMILEKLMLGNE
ncbi:hypothetical protein BLNAU_17502 [Blattamonas nauphoetae]|uniref:Uncharacterized protein n=1 Tax=Blattamonas nauphoetae TaxID=2049346 RepID=A0ABQ9X8M7_9EUKA|nr:hypothetical protein BLNAU_17502 [Blattamonas nauphoetae]